MSVAGNLNRTSKNSGELLPLPVNPGKIVCLYRDGVTDAVEPTIVDGHDFPSCGNGKLIPHGIYDIRKKAVSLHLN